MTGLRKGLALLLAMTLIMAIMPAIALAAGEGALWVNGVDIVAATDNTVVCGGGTATYDAANENAYPRQCNHYKHPYGQRHYALRHYGRVGF